MPLPRTSPGMVIGVMELEVRELQEAKDSLWAKLVSLNLVDPTQYSGFSGDLIRNAINKAKARAGRSELLALKDNYEKKFNQFVVAYQPLVRKIAGPYRRHCDGTVGFEDLIQEGNLGLNRALEKYDLKKGVRFSSYARPWIWGAIIETLKRNNLIKIPTKKINKLKKVFRQLIQELQRRPSQEELSARTGMDRDEILLMLKMSQKQVHLEDQSGDKEGLHAIDNLEDPNAEDIEEEIDRKNRLKQVDWMSTKVLTAKERKVLFLCFEKHKTLSEIGKILRLSPARVRQIKMEGLRKLRHALPKDNSAKKTTHAKSTYLNVVEPKIKIHPSWLPPTTSSEPKIEMLQDKTGKSLLLILATIDNLVSKKDRDELKKNIRFQIKHLRRNSRELARSRPIAIKSTETNHAPLPPHGSLRVARSWTTGRLSLEGKNELVIIKFSRRNWKKDLLAAPEIKPALCGSQIFLFILVAADNLVSKEDRKSFNDNINFQIRSLIGSTQESDKPRIPTKERLSWEKKLRQSSESGEKWDQVADQACESDPDPKAQQGRDYLSHAKRSVTQHEKHRRFMIDENESIEITFQKREEQRPYLKLKCWVFKTGSEEECFNAINRSYTLGYQRPRKKKAPKKRLPFFPVSPARTSRS